MAWWQVVLVFLGSIAVGLAVGFVVYLAVVKVTERRKAAARQRTAAAWATAPPKAPVDPPPAAAKPPPAPVRPSPAAPPVKTAEPRPVESSPADLVAEVDANRRVASGAWNGKLQQFQTRAWDNRGDEVHELPPDLREQLAEAYSDMSLANSIVWLATEMGRRSDSLDDSYSKLRTSIAGRLDQVYVRLGAASRPVSPS